MKPRIIKRAGGWRQVGPGGTTYAARPVQRHQAEAAKVARRRRFTRLGAVLGAIVVIVILVAVSSSGGGKTAASSSAPVAGAPASRALLDGIPQRGLVLGAANAPVRVVEFADLQCPFCRDYSVGVMPGVVRKYVRTGKARMEFNTLAFIGPDSVRAGRVAEAAALQNRLWNFVDLVYHNQGTENTGYANDAYLERIAAAVPGLDAAKAFAERDSAAVTSSLKAADDLANKNGIRETPTFLVGRGSNLKAVDAAGLPAAIKAAVGA
jgi:protein-disulfide isomerase